MEPLVFVMICEAAADFRTAAGLVERVICDCVDYIDIGEIEYFYQWQGRTAQFSFWLWSEIDDQARLAGIKVRGHFDQEPGSPDAHIARRALNYLRSRWLDGDPLDGVLLVRDDDGDRSRRVGLEQARDSVPDLRDRIVIALAHLKRECWVLNGLVPTDQEAVTVDEIRRQLGFDPVTESHKLTAKQDHETRSAKRVLKALTCDDYDREQACWNQTSLALLYERGELTGLRAFLEETKDRLPPLFPGQHHRKSHQPT